MPPLRLLVLHLGQGLTYGPLREPGPASESSPPSMPEAGAEWLFAYADTILEPDAKLHEEFQGKAVDPEELGPGIFRVDPGDYFFSQWDTEDFKEPITGLRAFAEAVEDESKNKGRRTKGPWMLRVLHKEGGTRFQGFKRISV